MTIAYPLLHISNELGQTSHTFEIKHLRGYGQLKDVFSFETGRKCPGGVQVYFLIVKEGVDVFLALNAAVAKENDGVAGDRYDHLPSLNNDSGKSCANNHLYLYFCAQLNNVLSISNAFMTSQ